MTLVVKYNEHRSYQKTGISFSRHHINAELTLQFSSNPPSWLMFVVRCSAFAPSVQQWVIRVIQRFHALLIIIHAHRRQRPRHLLLHLWPNLLTFAQHLVRVQGRLRNHRVSLKRVSIEKTWIFAKTMNYRNPVVVHDLLYRQPLGRLDVQHSANQFFSVFAHVLPLGVGEGVLAHAYPLLHARRYRQAVVTIKRRKTAQPKNNNFQPKANSRPANLQNIHDNPQRPDIATLVVLLGP